jgi:hypothetical protein
MFSTMFLTDSAGLAKRKSQIRATFGYLDAKKIIHATDIALLVLVLTTFNFFTFPFHEGYRR